MEKALSAYSLEHITRYFNEVKDNGLREHGFPRLTANIGILISHGSRVDLLPLFLEMMEFCCKNIPTVKAANDFSVREIISCLCEIEKSEVTDKETTERWRAYLKTIILHETYNVFAVTVTDTVRNWALFSAVSEYFRQTAGLADSSDFIDLQLKQQIQWLNEDGMYKDNSKSDNHQPIMYDIVPRGLFSLLLDQGYRGKYYAEIDENLKKAALLTLGMQSPNGEMAFGGRSNQFLHNEAWMIAIFEYEAKRYYKEGNLPLASRFRAAAERALCVTESWLSTYPIRHIKNRFPTETKYGCETYAYFDKYMITVASNIYAAYQICDDSIPFEKSLDLEPCVAKTRENFHKLFLKCGGYGIEFDLDADSTYDANGLGRVHRIDAPSTICLSAPCPKTPKYKVDSKESFPFSLSSAVCDGGVWKIGADEESRYEILSTEEKDCSASAELLCRFDGGRIAREFYSVSWEGVRVSVRGDGEIGYALPAFSFDGEKHTEITVSDSTLTVVYEGWLCRYETDGKIISLGKTARNRNGHYRTYLATGSNMLNIRIEIIKIP